MHPGRGPAWCGADWTGATGTACRVRALVRGCVGASCVGACPGSTRRVCFPDPFFFLLPGIIFFVFSVK